jgi:hypothetical protein
MQGILHTSSLEEIWFSPLERGHSELIPMMLVRLLSSTSIRVLVCWEKYEWEWASMLSCWWIVKQTEEFRICRWEERYFKVDFTPQWTIPEGQAMDSYVTAWWDYKRKGNENEFLVPAGFITEKMSSVGRSRSIQKQKMGTYNSTCLDNIMRQYVSSVVCWGPYSTPTLVRPEQGWHKGRAHFHSIHFGCNGDITPHPS